MAIGKSICWTDVNMHDCDVHCYDVTNTSVIVKNNYCVELLLRKSLGGEFVTTTVKTPPGWPVRLCIAAGLTMVETPHEGSGKFPKVIACACEPKLLHVLYVAWLHLH